MSAEFARVFRRLIRPLESRVKLMIGRAVLHLVDDARKIQAAQIQAFAGEILDNVERFQQYGFSGTPHPGAECVLLSLGGMRQHPIIVAIDDRRFRPTGLEEGEVVIYTSQDPSEAHRIWLKNGHIVRIDANDDVSLELSPDHIRAEKGSEVILEMTSDHIRAEKTDEVTLELTSNHIIAEIDPSGQMATPSRITLEGDHVLVEKGDEASIEMTADQIVAEIAGGQMATPSRVTLTADHVLAEKDSTQVELVADAVNVTGDTTITGELTVTGETTIQDDLTVQGDIDVTGDVDGVDVSTHRHGGVMSGGSQTSGPV